MGVQIGEKNMSQQGLHSTLLLVAAVGATALCPAVATASGSTSPASSTAVAAAPGPVQGSLSDNGVRVYIDAKTHKIRPATAEERAAESAAAPALQPKFKIDRLPNGALRAQDLNGSLMESAEVTRSADGTLTYSHVQGDTTAMPVSQPAAKLEEK